MTIDEQIIDIRSSKDSFVRSDFIEAYIPFVVGQTSRVTNQYIDGQSDERFIVALEAFNEAIDRYESDKGKFLSYAATVIRSRLTDWMRSEKRRESKVAVKAFIDITAETTMEEKYLLKEEVLTCKNKLATFGISFDDLVDKAPQKEKTARKVTDIGRRAGEDENIVAKLYKTLKLPIQEMSERLRVTKRILKTHRDFIVTVIVVFKEDYRLIGEFLLKSEER